MDFFELDESDTMSNRIVHISVQLFSNEELARQVWKDYIMTFWKRQNYGDNKEISVCQGLGEGRDE